MNVASRAPQMKRDWLDWPFFGESHRAFAGALDRFVASGAIAAIDHGDIDGSCRKLVRALGEAGLLDAAVAPLDGDASAIDSRSVCLARETLAYHDGLADFAFAMQGLGSGAVAIAGSDEQRRLVLPKVRSGEWLAAFALSEKEAGSDVAAMACSAREDGNGYRLDGEKTWISNGGIADVYTLFARTGEAPGARGISAFLVFPDDPGFSIAERIDVMAPHPLATLRFEGCRLPADRRLGGPGEGFKIAMRTLDIFRASVAAAALGFARRAFDEALAHAKSRKMFGATLADLQLTQAALGDMATEIDAAALLDLSRRMAPRRPEAADDSRGRHGEDDRNGDRAARHRSGVADVRWPRGQTRRDCREPLSRDPRLAHLRRRNRGAEAHRRARADQVAAVVTAA